MMRGAHFGAAVFCILYSCASISQAQTNVYWHTDPSFKTCSMVIDPSLTQAQWHRFVQQVGALSSFKSLASARTVGRMNLHVAFDYVSTPVDQHDLAWINTFAHPDATCPLGDAIAYPALRARLGASDRVDVGGYWTTAKDANYGLVGAEVKYALLRESERSPAAAVRASVSMLTGVPDFDLSIYSLEVLASKVVARATPYLGIRTSRVVATETTPKIDLHSERVSIAQGYLGVTYILWALNLAAEYDVSTVNSLAFAIGHDF